GVVDSVGDLVDGVDDRAAVHPVRPERVRQQGGQRLNRKVLDFLGIRVPQVIVGRVGVPLYQPGQQVRAQRRVLRGDGKSGQGIERQRRRGIVRECHAGGDAVDGITQS